jgi:peptidoglycan/LPS O-acetylase OafA/YrhL
VIKKKPANRMLELDVLRGLAAAGVLLFHYTTQYVIFYPHQGDPLFYFVWIPLRIQLFAMISGFVIVMILEKTKSPMDFIVGRFSRLYPCYFVAVIFTSLLLIQFSWLGRGTHITWPQFFVHLTMLHTWFGYNNIDNVYWYLATELSFYFIIFFFFTFKKMKYIEGIGFFGLILVVLNARYGRLGPFGIPAVVVVSRILCFWQYFFAGILFFNIKTKGDVWWRHAGLAMCFIVQNVVSDDIHSVLCLAVDFIIFYLFIYDKLSWIVQRPLLFLGTISYSLYLIHLNMGQLIIKYLYTIGANAWLRLIIPTLVSVFVATIMTYGIEKPAMKYIRTKYTQWQQTGSNVITERLTHFIFYWSLFTYFDLLYSHAFSGFIGQIALLALIGVACRPRSLGGLIAFFLLIVMHSSCRFLFLKSPHTAIEFVINCIILISLMIGFLRPVKIREMSKDIFYFLKPMLMGVVIGVCFDLFIDFFLRIKQREPVFYTLLLVLPLCFVFIPDYIFIFSQRWGQKIREQFHRTIPTPIVRYLIIAVVILVPFFYSKN